MDDPRSDHELLHAAQADNDGDAFDLVVRRWLPKVWPWALSATRNPDVAADVVQNVFLKLQERLDNPEPIKVLGSYLRAMVRNEAMRVAKATRGEISTDLLDDGVEVSDSVDDFQALVDAVVDIDVLCCWLQAIAAVISERAADIAHLLAAGFSAPQIVAELDELLGRKHNVDVVYRTTNRIRKRWDAVIEEHDRQPVLHQWALQRWGYTPHKKEAK